MQLIAQLHSIFPALALILFTLAAAFPRQHPVLKAALYIGAGCLLGLAIGWTLTH